MAERHWRGLRVALALAVDVGERLSGEIFSQISKNDSIRASSATLASRSCEKSSQRMAINSAAAWSARLASKRDIQRMRFARQDVIEQGVNAAERSRAIHAIFTVAQR